MMRVVFRVQPRDFGVNVDAVMLREALPKPAVDRFAAFLVVRDMAQRDSPPVWRLMPEPVRAVVVRVRYAFLPDSLPGTDQAGLFLDPGQICQIMFAPLGAIRSAFSRLAPDSGSL